MQDTRTLGREEGDIAELAPAPQMAVDATLLAWKGVPLWKNLWIQRGLAAPVPEIKFQDISGIKSQLGSIRPGHRRAGERVLRARDAAQANLETNLLTCTTGSSLVITMRLLRLDSETSADLILARSQNACFQSSAILLMSSLRSYTSTGTRSRLLIRVDHIQRGHHPLRAE